MRVMVGDITTTVRNSASPRVSGPLAAADRPEHQRHRQAAEQGRPEAQYELALMYELGLGVEQDVDEAARWYGLSAGQACPAELTAGGRLGDR